MLVAFTGVGPTTYSVYILDSIIETNPFCRILDLKKTRRFGFGNDIPYNFST